MRMSFAVERLLTGELAPHCSLSREHYGRSLQLVAWGHRLIVDLIR